MVAIPEDAEIAIALSAGARSRAPTMLNIGNGLMKKSRNLTASPFVVESWVSLVAPGCPRLQHVARGATNIKLDVTPDQASDAAFRLLQGQVATHDADKN